MSFKKTGSHYDKNLKEWLEHFEAEYESDVSALPPANPGSTCYIKETGTTVKLAYNGVWGGPEQPFGYETTTVKEVLAECQPFYYDGESSGEFSYFVIENQFRIVAGEKYVVNWNGAEFTSEAVEQEGILFLGNLSAFGMEDTGEPFMVRMGDGNEDYVAMAMPLDGSTTLTISIRQEVTEVQKISGKYVEGMGYEEDGTIHPIDPNLLPIKVKKLYCQVADTDHLWKNPDDVGDGSKALSYDEALEIAKTMDFIYIIQNYGECEVRNICSNINFQPTSGFVEFGYFILGGSEYLSYFIRQ